MRVLKNYAPMCTSHFGNREYWWNGQLIKDYHIGIDIVANINGIGGFDNIVAVASGIVELVVNDIAGYVGGMSYGNQIVINHGNGFKTRYAHLKQWSIPFNVGASVQEGQVIGYMGSTGSVTAGHLHFEIIKNSNVINPYDYIFGSDNFNPKPITLPTTHIVVSGETVASVCRKYYGVAEQKYFDLIKQANGLNDKFLIVIGQVLNIPIYKEEVKPIEPPKEEKPIEEPPIENNDLNDHSSDKEDKPINDTENEQTFDSDTNNQEIEAHPNLFVEIFKIIVKFLKEMFKK